MGDYLVVGLSTDEFNCIKGKTSFFPYEKRKALLEAIRYVDLVIPENNWEQKIKDIKDFTIDVFVIGDHLKGKLDYLKECGVEVIYFPRTPEISTAEIKNRLSQKNSKD